MWRPQHSMRLLYIAFILSDLFQVIKRCKILTGLFKCTIFLFSFKHTDLSHYLEKYPSGLHPHNAKVRLKRRRNPENKKRAKVPRPRTGSIFHKAFLQKNIIVISLHALHLISGLHLVGLLESHLFCISQSDFILQVSYQTEIDGGWLKLAIQISLVHARGGGVKGWMGTTIVLRYGVHYKYIYFYLYFT